MGCLRVTTPMHGGPNEAYLPGKEAIPEPRADTRLQPVRPALNPRERVELRCVVTGNYSLLRGPSG